MIRVHLVDAFNPKCIKTIKTKNKQKQGTVQQGHAPINTGRAECSGF